MSITCGHSDSGCSIIRSASGSSASISRPRGSWSFVSVYGGSCGTDTRHEPQIIRIVSPAFGVRIRGGGNGSSGSGQAGSPSSFTPYGLELAGSSPSMCTSA